MDITVLHNPRCSTSRAALAACEEADVEPTIVRYLDTPLNEQAVLDLLEILEDDPADLIRRDATFQELDLSDEDIDSPEKVAALLAEHPKLMQRPVLITEGRAIIGRPKDRVPTFLADA
ncbi:MAG: ArsC/Spx/MgsR family protein [Mobilicoccus sp.]|nr:ArsC/Spx/MgsR family protein [Mobilicoccus sp.]